MMPFEFLEGVFCQRLTWALLHFLWQGFVVAGVMSLLLWWLRSGRAESRYMACLAGLLLMAACPALTFSVLASRTARDGGRPLDGTVPLQDFVAIGTEADYRPAAEPASAPLVVPRMVPIQPYVLAGWGAGVLLLGLKLLFGLAGLRRLVHGRRAVPVELAGRAASLGKHLGFRKCPTVFLSEKVSEAIAIGFVRPTVLLPAAWLLEMTPEVLEAVIAHELAHLRRGDLWVNLSQRVIEALLFYHPAVWWLSRRIRWERELCCDVLAVAATGRRADYLRALQWVAQKRTSPTSPRLEAAMGGSDMALLNRVRYLIGMEQVRGRVPWWPAGLAILVTLGGLWSVTCLSTGELSQVQAAEQGKPSQPVLAAPVRDGYDATPSDVRAVGAGVSLNSEGVVHEAPFVWLDYLTRSEQPPAELPPASNQPIPVSAGRNIYWVQCAIIKRDGDREPQRLSAPQVWVREGQRAIGYDSSQTPIVSAVKGDGDAKKPTIHVLDDGIMWNVTAYGNSDGRITLDAKVELSRIGRVEVKDGRQTTQVKTQRMRTIDCVKPGEKVVVKFDPVEDDPVRTSVEFVVTQIKPSEEGTSQRPQERAAPAARSSPGPGRGSKTPYPPNHEEAVHRNLSIKFVGNSAVTRARLQDAIKTKPGPLGGGPDGAQLKEDVNRLVAHYGSKGHFFAKVSGPVLEDGPGESLTATFMIDEGPRCRVSKVRLEPGSGNPRGNHPPCR